MTILVLDLHAPTLSAYANELFRCDAEEAAKTFGPQRSIPGITASALAIIVAFINTPIALALLTIYPALYALPEKFLRRNHPLTFS